MYAFYTGYSKYTMYMSEDSTIRISKKMKKQLEELGTLADTYETVIQKLYDHYMKNGKNKTGGKK